jgi:hypothetical protein
MTFSPSFGIFSGSYGGPSTLRSARLAGGSPRDGGRRAPGGRAPRKDAELGECITHPRGSASHRSGEAAGTTARTAEILPMTPERFRRVYNAARTHAAEARSQDFTTRRLGKQRLDQTLDVLAAEVDCSQADQVAWASLQRERDFPATRRRRTGIRRPLLPSRDDRDWRVSHGEAPGCR